MTTILKKERHLDDPNASLCAFNQKKLKTYFDALIWVDGQKNTIC